MSRPVARLAALLLTPVTAGCDGCPGGKPYTPYGLDAGASSDASATEEAGASGAAFVPAAAKQAAEGGARWVLDGETIDAPVGRVFDTGLELDVDGDGRRDLLAWARSPRGARGELVLRRGGRDEAPRVVAAPPGEVVDAPKCGARAALSQVGARAVLVDVSTDCPPDAAPRKARWLGVVQMDALTRLVLDVTVPRVPAGETVNVELAAADADADGRDDLTASVTLDGAPAPLPREPPGAERATLRWLDRPQGLSPDPAEPTASLAARAAGLAVEARNKSQATAVRSRARGMRRLVELVCGSGGVRPSTGPTSCDRVSALGDVAFADGVAALALGDPVAAAASLAELRALSPEPGPRQKDLERRFATAFPFAVARVVRRSRAAPAASAKSGLGSLAFDGDGELLVRTSSGVVRLGAGEEAATDAQAWPDPLATDDAAWTLARVEQRCDEPVLVAVLRGPAGERDAPLPVLAPVTADGFPAAECRRIEIGATPLGSARESIAVAIGGAMIGISVAGGTPAARLIASPMLADVPVRGTARCPDGTAVALPTPRGLVVWSTSGARLWTGDALAGARGCVPESGGARVACAIGESAVLFEAEAPPPAASAGKKK